MKTGLAVTGSFRGGETSGTSERAVRARKRERGGTLVEVTPSPNCRASSLIVPVYATAGSAFTLPEVLISLAIALLSFSGVVAGYLHSTYKAEWSGYSLAAQAMAVQQLEQARCANWDIKSIPVRNELTNVPTLSFGPLDLPISGTNVIWATNYVTITSIAIPNTLNASVYMVRVDTVWPFRWRNTTRYFTNSLADYFAPD
jgi:type II secretory pathway pseudopilin PulG